MRFFDLGQIKNEAGDWIDLPFNLPTTFVDPTGTLPIEVLPITADDWQTLQDLFFSVDRADWTTYYRQLEYETAERYSVDLTDGSGAYWSTGRTGSRFLSFTETLITGDYWKPEGLVIPPEEMPEEFIFTNYGAFLRIGNLEGFFKITTEPEFSADHVEGFTLSAVSDIFFVPALMTMVGQSISEDFLNADAMALKVRSPLKREFWLNREDTTWQYPLLSYRDTGTTLDHANILALIEHFKPLCRHFDASPFADNVADEVSPSTFPIYDSYHQILISSAGISGDLISPIGDGNPIPGTFIGAVKQNGSFYYFWEVEGGGFSQPEMFRIFQGWE